MAIERIDLNKPEWNFTFSNCVVAGDFVFTSHVGGYDAEASRWPETIEGQTRQCFATLSRYLAAAGATLDDVVRINVLLKRTEDFQGMREVYRHQFANGYPVRTAWFTEFLDEECLIQIDAVAYKPG